MYVYKYSIRHWTLLEIHSGRYNSVLSVHRRSEQEDDKEMICWENTGAAMPEDQ